MRGEVVVELVTDVLDRLAPGSVLHTDDGPLVVAAARPHQRRHIVSFLGVAGREAAERLRGAVLRAEPIDDPDALWVHEVIGAGVVLADGTACGTVETVEANPADDILVLDTGALVPARFVVGWDDGRRLVIDPPEGLLGP